MSDIYAILNVYMKDKKNDYIPTMRMYVGISKSKGTNCKYSFAVSLEADNSDALLLPPKTVKPIRCEATLHYVILSALRYGLESIIGAVGQAEINVLFYPDNDEIAFEWNVEHITDKCFAKTTKDKSLWNDVVKLIENSHLHLDIHGENSVLSGIDKLEGRRIQHESK